MDGVPLIFEKSRAGRKAYSFPACDVPEQAMSLMLPESFRRQIPPELPEVSEVDAVRHFTALSGRNHGVDSGFYPLGSCTMKYNPKLNEDMAALPGFSGAHPLQGDGLSQGALALMYQLEAQLCELTGMDAFSLQPAAGAHGEMAGLMMMKAWHDSHGDTGRRKVIVPDTAHGTNPASAAVVGYDVVQVRSDARGNVDIPALKELAGPDIAGLMLTNPSTLGLFEENIREIADIIHSAGGLLYYDGANANAILGISRPGDMGFDIVHLNLHKTFSTPHGGGGPGAGPVGVRGMLEPFLPSPCIRKGEGGYALENRGVASIGRIRSFYGNFGVLVRAYTYILTMGSDGLKRVSEMAVLNANYLLHLLKPAYDVPFDRVCMHEFVVSASRQKELGVTALDIAKRLLDFGYHPPTIYFPAVVREALMIEPTETESIETLEAFAQTLLGIAREAEEEPDTVKHAPYHTPVSRLDEARAARTPVLTCGGLVT